jgi:drug/metabolite transporter (DMT)-like permease
MDINVFLAVIFAAFLHALWNSMVKSHEDKHVAVAAIVLGHIPASLVIILLLPMPTIESLPYIIASALIHQGYQWFLLTAYRHGDYTRVYPIARGTGPVVVTIVLLLFFGVKLSIYELLGIIVISIGILSLSAQDRHSFFPWIARRNARAISFALLTGLFIGGYSIVDGYGARASLSPLSFMGWSFVVNALIFPILLKIMKQQSVVKRVFSEAKLLFWFGGTISYIVYAIVVWGFTQAPIPLVSALRETSVIIALLIGTLFLKERFTILKTLSILVIFAGVVLLKFF